LFYFSTTKRVLEGKHDNQIYLVKEIKSINSWYIIYAEKQNSLYKIVTKYDERRSKFSKKIISGNYYILELYPQSDSAPIIGGVKLRPVNYIDMPCFTFDERTAICIEPERGIYDLYCTKDLNGLWYIPNLKKINKGNE